MESFSLLEPEVAGGFGELTELDASVHPPAVSRLHYEFHGWLGDDLLESFPCFIVSGPLAASIEAAGLTGFRLAPVDVSVSQEFVELQPETQLPSFAWLQVSGTAGAHDFGLSSKSQLVVSPRALDVLRGHRLAHCQLSRWV